MPGLSEQRCRRHANFQTSPAKNTAASAPRYAIQQTDDGNSRNNTNNSTPILFRANTSAVTPCDHNDLEDEEEESKERFSTMMVPYEEPRERRRPRQQQNRAPRPNSYGPGPAALVVYNPQQRQVAPARQPHQEYASKGPLHLRDVDIRQSYKVRNRPRT